MTRQEVCKRVILFADRNGGKFPKAVELTEPEGLAMAEDISENYMSAFWPGNHVPSAGEIFDSMRNGTLKIMGVPLKIV